MGARKSVRSRRSEMVDRSKVRKCECAVLEECELKGCGNIVALGEEARNELCENVLKVSLTNKIDNFNNTKGNANNPPKYIFPQFIEESEDDQTTADTFPKSIVIKKQIGQGAYACVKLAYHKDYDRLVALKVYDKARVVQTQRQGNIQREIKILKKISNSYIVKAYDAFETSTQIVLVMEYVKGCTLRELLKKQPGNKLTEERARKVFRQIVSGVSYCHKHSIAHRDIKLDNVLLNEYDGVKIIDFGFSTYTHDNKKGRGFCGTPSYMAPEILLRRPYVGQPADVWALGVLLYALAAGTLPFRGVCNKELNGKIVEGRVEYPFHFSPPLKALLSRMLQTDPERRVTAVEILADAWLNEASERPHSRQTYSFGQGRFAAHCRASTEGKVFREVNGRVQWCGNERAEMLKVQNRVKRRAGSQVFGAAVREELGN